MARIDPVDIETRLGLGTGKSISVAKLLDHFEENHRTRRNGRRPKDDRDTARRCATVRARWGSLPASELTHVDVAKLLAEITERGAPYEANRVRALVRLVWNMARRWVFVPAAMINPAEGTPANRERARDVGARSAHTEEDQRQHQEGEQQCRRYGEHDGARVLGCEDARAHQRLL